MAVKYCPECGKFIDEGKESAVKHAFSHWGVMPNRVHEIRSKEARERYAALISVTEEE
ncbi:MAG: hypothetical protein PHQ43_06160 [Dehalococcoidales bacterium]|nr:hypothetical protein [Dehalococcoidales bacterium]